MTAEPLSAEEERELRSAPVANRNGSTGNRVDRLLATLDRDRERLAALEGAAEAVIRQAEADDDFDGQFIDYLVPFDAIEALRAALKGATS